MQSSQTCQKRLSFKLQPFGRQEQSNPVSKCSFIDKVVGKANEVPLTVNGQAVIALLDTKSMVSTMSVSLCKALGLEIKPLDHLLTVESAGGHQLSYLGYIEVTITCTDISVVDLCDNAGIARYQVS